MPKWFGGLRCVVWMCIVLGGFALARAAEVDKPNIILIMADDV